MEEPFEAIVRRYASLVYNLRSLSLGVLFRQPGIIDTLATAPHLQGLTNLDVHLPDSPDEPLVAILTACRNLERLTLCAPSQGGNRLSPILTEGARALASLGALAHLDLSDAFRELIHSSLAETLVSLSLPSGNLDPVAAVEFARVNDFPRLRSLTWNGGTQNCTVGDDLVTELAKARSLAGLTRLSLRVRALHSAMPLLVEVPPWSGLLSLDLEGNGIDDEVALEMAARANLPQLELLNLVDTRLKNIGFWALTTAPGLPSLRFVNAINTLVSAELFGISYFWLNNRTPGCAWDAPESPLSDEQKDLVRSSIE